jgi:hypothetical protein
VPIRLGPLQQLVVNDLRKANVPPAAATAGRLWSVESQIRTVLAVSALMGSLPDGMPWAFGNDTGRNIVQRRRLPRRLSLSFDFRWGLKTARALLAMIVYAKYVLPRLIDLAMRNKDATRLRTA